MSNEPYSRTDIALLRKALREDWAMSPATRVEALRKVKELADSAKSPRTKIMAVRTLIAAGALNIRQGMLDLAREKFEAERGDASGPTVADAVRDMKAAAERYEREHPGDRDGAGEVPDRPGEVQPDDPGP